jgi:hypothetical protein
MKDGEPEGPLGRAKGKERRGKEGCPSFPLFSLFLDDGLHGTHFSARPAFGALLLVDHIGFAFFDGFNGTLLGAGPTSHTFFGDHIGHRSHPLRL